MPLHYDYDLKSVLPFLTARLPGFCLSENMTAIGVRRDGDLVAAVAYEFNNGVNCWMHVAASPGSRWLCKGSLARFFGYPFLIGGLKRVSAHVNASNTTSRRLVQGLGFVEEATLKGAAKDGGDVIIYAMTREECRYV